MSFNNGHTITTREVTRTAKEQDVAFANLKSVDLPGVLQHITLLLCNIKDLPKELA